MEKNKKESFHRILRIVSGIFLVISVIVFIALGIAVQIQDLHDTYALAEETYSFLQNECEKYDNYMKGMSAKAKQDILDKAIGLRKFISTDQLSDTKFLQEFIRTEHVGGVLVLNNDLSVVAQADMDDQDSYELWKNQLTLKSIKEVMKYPKKKYVDQVVLNDIPYDYAVISNNGNGLLLCYSSSQKPTRDPYELAIGKFLINNSFHKNPKVLITADKKILATNDPDLEGKKTKECKITRKSGIDWRKNKLTQISYKGTSWYGIQRVYNTYSIYILYPYSEVFSNRTNFMIIGFMLYLIAGMVILLVQRHYDKANIRKLQNQMNIIDAINVSYSSTILLHLDKMELEGLKVSEALDPIFSENMDPYRCMDYLCENCIGEECRQSVRDFLEFDTIAKRLRDQKYLLSEVCDIKGTWYSLLVIPQRYDEEGRVQAVLIVSRDITASKRAEELSYRDKLTGLYNRNYLESRSGHFTQTEDDYPASLIMADCNYLKRTNDTLGHEYGDLLLKRIAKIIQESIPETAMAIRAGGDEFLIVCLKCDREEAKKLVKKIKQRMAEESNETIHLSAAFGICTVLNDEVSFEEAYEMADREMYKEKRSTRV